MILLVSSWLVRSRADEVRVRDLEGLYEGSIRALPGGSWLVISGFASRINLVVIRVIRYLWQIAWFLTT